MNNHRRNPYQDHPVLGKHPDQELTYNETVERFSELFKHHGIREDGCNAFIDLAFKLAEEFVPAFQPKKKRGPKRQWSLPESIIVHDTVNRLKTV